jgi:hypothetical protein
MSAQVAIMLSFFVFFYTKKKKNLSLVGFLFATVMEECSRTEGFWILQCFFFNPTRLPSVCSTSRSRETRCSIRLPLVGTLHTFFSGFCDMLMNCFCSGCSDVGLSLYPPLNYTILGNTRATNCFNFNKTAFRVYIMKK